MYIPSHFHIGEQETIVDFIAANGFGELISQVDGRPFATPMPFLLSDDQQTLLGHLAIQNPQAEQLAESEQEVLVTLSGPHAYISPTWYTTPGVPTWNYQTVHIYGRCQTFNDAARLQRVVAKLSQQYESALPEPWQADYNPAMLRAIVGIEIKITEWQCKFKLSQNRSLADRTLVADKLSEAGNTALAMAMREQVKP
ncbi:FMN-binding negative transcriptional regulator [Halioxenophilus sp. WMMB6]|uniref:FMN-binding negative transcriptional regulator n=1 Tax=Halioxenophilus sp. WMMB6 TaxID=3073815 RepID=UPI00295E35A3|nr:FMN-binding negative transcriptional regulator [Halioxenophilus sp. WMMB6]